MRQVEEMAWNRLRQYVRPGITDCYKATPQERVELAKMIKAAADLVLNTHT